MVPASVFSEVEVVLSNVIFEHDEIIVAGDATVDFLTQNPKKMILDNIFTVFGLQLIFTKPSRSGATSSTLIDIIAVSHGLFLKRLIKIY